MCTPRFPLLATALVGAGLLLLTACSPSDDGSSPAASAPTANAPVTAATTEDRAATEAPGASSAAPARLVAHLVNLGADRCIPCKQMVPVREALAAEYPDSLAVSFIDVWADRAAGARHRTRVIPTQIIQDADGHELFRHEGYWPKEDILRKFAELGLDLGPAREVPGT